MKVSVSLPADEVEFLDDYTLEHRLGSRSAAVQRAISALRAQSLRAAYGEAFAESADVAGDWDAAVADGLAHEQGSDAQASGR